MTSVKVFLKTSKTYSDGRHPLIIQVIHRRRKYTKQLGKLFPEFWDERKTEVRATHDHHNRINKIIVQKLHEVHSYLLDCQARSIEPDPGYFFTRTPANLTLCQAIIRKADALNLKEQFRSEAKYRTTSDKVKVAELDIQVNAITSRSLGRFQSYHINKGNKQNTIAKDLENLRTIFNELRREGVIDRSPFDTFQIKRIKSQKGKLNEVEFAAWCNAEPSNPRHILARDVFACATMLRGMRAHDILTLRTKQIKEDRLHYTAQKTGKSYDMKIPDACMRILEPYLAQASDYVFPLVTMPPGMYRTDKNAYERHVNAKNSYVNKYCKELAVVLGIRKTVTMHIARHTFGYLADRSGVSVTSIQSLYGHSSLNMTERYIQELRENDELDKAVEGLF